MSYQNEQKIIEKSIPDLCIKCREMYGHETFSNMCSKCFKAQKMETELLENKEKNDNISQVIRKNTDLEEKQKVEKTEEKQSLPVIRRETNRTGEEKNERQRTRQKQEKKILNKCSSCNKKVGMLGYECKHCVNTFCKFHRLPEDHQCTVDFITAGKKALTEANPQIKTRKLSGIDH